MISKLKTRRNNMDKETRRMFEDVFKMLDGIVKQLQTQSELNESIVSILSNNDYLDQDINV
jgi:exonuclease VII small subunit